MSIRRAILYSRFGVRFSRSPDSNSRCVVLGNGPSLADDIPHYITIDCAVDILCVGRIAESDVYSQIRPKYYVFADPLWWSSSANETVLSVRRHLFDVIKIKTTWNLTVYAPFEAEKLLNGVFNGHPNIEMAYYNNIVASGLPAVKYRLYDMNLAIPPAFTVLISALFLAIRIGYKEVILLGADHSWHESLVLDEANRPCVRDSHFYDKHVMLKPISIDGSDDNGMRMDRLFLTIGRMFEGHWEISEYAKRSGVNVINSSSKTYVDAYERKSIELALGGDGRVVRVNCDAATE